MNADELSASDFLPSPRFEWRASRYNCTRDYLKMAKKKTPAVPNPDITPEAVSSEAPKRRRAPAKRSAEPETPASIADDRGAMPEAAGQRVTPADTANADSVNFVALESTPTYEEIAEAAYHRYLSRGATDGQDFDDWLEAERALKVK